MVYSINELTFYPRTLTRNCYWVQRKVVEITSSCLTAEGFISNSKQFAFFRDRQKCVANFQWSMRIFRYLKVFIIILYPG